MNERDSTSYWFNLNTNGTMSSTTYTYKTADNPKDYHIEADTLKCAYCGREVVEGVVSNGKIFCTPRHTFLNKLKESSKESILK